jgi:hypothetical protein
MLEINCKRIKCKPLKELHIKQRDHVEDISYKLLKIFNFQIENENGRVRPYR